MGTCGSADNKKKATAPSTEIKNNDIKKDDPNKVQPSKEKPPERVDNPEPVQSAKISTITIVVKHNDNEIHSADYAVNQTLKEVYANLNMQKDCDYELLTSNNESILSKLQDKLEEIFKDCKDKDQFNLIIKYAGLVLPENIQIAYVNTTKKIGSLMLDNPDQFAITTFNSMTSKTASFGYILEQTNLLRKFNSFSAYCNGQNKIFISGGENGSTNLNDFIYIDLETLTEKEFKCTTLPNLVQARTWHSMIYVPNDYIFIVSGTGNKTVELYDIKTNTIKLDSELKEERSECTLCCLNNCELYAFCGFLLRETFITSIERCNLKKCKRTWETVPYSLQDNITFAPSFFSIGFYQNDSVILFGSNENVEEKNKSYLFQSRNNTEELSEYQLNNNLIGIFREKFLLPLTEKYSFIMPILSNDTQVFCLDNNNGQIKKADLKKSVIV